MSIEAEAYKLCGEFQKSTDRKAGLTQQQVADALGLERSAIAHFEMGDSTPNFKNLPKICELLNVGIEKLI